MHKILIVEDDINISNMLAELLTGRGYQTSTAFSGTECLLKMQLEAFDLVLLDLMLPGLSGQQVLEKVRADSNIPVICVTAKDDIESKVTLIKNGADDYLTKPFNNEELIVRIEAVLRRKHTGSSAIENVLRYKDIALYPESVKAEVAGRPLLLTKSEFKILELFMRYPGKVFSKNNIFESVWEEEYFGDDNTVNVHISNLRQKLVKAGGQQDYIQTVWGIGFKLQ